MSFKKEKITDNMGFSLNPFSKNYASMTPYAVGIDYINKFHEANGTSAVNYVNAMFTNLGREKAISEIEGLGRGIQVGGTSLFSSAIVPMSESEVKDSAVALAETSGGRVPNSIGAFRFALIGQATSTTFVDAIMPILEVGAKIGDPLIKAGETALSLADSIVEGSSMLAKVISFVPFVLPLAIGYGVYNFYTGGFIKGIIKGKV